MPTYTIHYDGNNKGCLSVFASGPIIALNDFHRAMQRNLKVPHTDYQVTKMTQDYISSAGGINPDGPWIESEFDLPQGPTPNVLEPRKRGKDETELMPFMGTPTNTAASTTYSQ